tara:strand:- start:278 stop:1765 length:1488 start_codon:yes stop_codon:yes gene_type:complete
MAGFYAGQMAREDRLRARKNLLEDRKADEDKWNARFKLENEQANATWLERNKITNQQAIAAAEKAAAGAAAVREESRAFELDVLALKRAYELDDRDAAQQWWKDQQVILNKQAEQKAVNAEGRLQAWDQKKFERDRAARQEDLRSEIGLRTSAANSQFDYQYNVKTEASKAAAIAAHANEMQKLLFERVMDGKVVGADFTAAVGGSGDPMAQIAQYSAAITALGVEKDNPVLAKLAGLNNPAVMKSTFETLQKYHTKIVESGRTDVNALDMFRSGANDFLSAIEITSPDPAQADKVIANMETALGKSLDDLTKSIIKSSVGTTGSALAVTEPVVIEPLDTSKMGDWTKIITQNAVARGRSEQNSISKALTSVNEMSKTGTPEQQAVAKELMDWLGARSLAVKEALDSARGDNPDYYGVTSLYGNNVIGEAMEAEPKLRTAVLPDYLKEAKDAEPIVVPNVSVLRSLIEYGIIKVGDVVTYTRDDGRTVTGPYKGK